MPRAVHFTHHACVQHQLWTPKTGAEHRTPDPLYVNGRNPSLSFCRVWGRRDTKRRSVHAADVTCTWCLGAMANDTREMWQAKARRAAEHDPESVREGNVRFWSNWANDRELTIRAWLTCCKDCGAPWPFDERERVKSERWYRAVRMTKAGDVGLVMFVGQRRTPESITDDLAGRIAELETADRALIAPVLADAERADKLLVEVQRLLASIKERAQDIATRIQSRALVSLPAARAT